MSTLDLLHRLIDRFGRRIFNEGYAAGYAAALAEAHHRGGGQGPGGVSWEKIARHAEANPQALSAWEKELADSVLCSLYYGVELTPRQKSKLEWIFRSRFGGKVS